MGFVADVVGGVADAVGSVVSGAADVLGGIADIPVIGDIAGMAANYFMPGSGFILDQFGSDSIFNGGGIGSLIGSVTSEFGGNTFGGVPNGFMPGEVGGLPTGGWGDILGGAGSIKDLVSGGLSLYQAFNAPKVQAPSAAQKSSDPYSPYRAQAASELNKLMANPNMVYGMPGYQFAQQQGSKQIQRSAAATGTLASGNTLASLQQQGAQTAQQWFDNYYAKLATMSGASNNPYQGQQAYTQAQEAQAQAKDAQNRALLQGVQGIMSSGFFG